MALKGEESIVAHHATAIVGDLDELAASAFDFEADVGSSGVERVLQHFLDHGRGAVDDLASGDLVGNLVGEYADAAHFHFHVIRKWCWPHGRTRARDAGCNLMPPVGHAWTMG